MSPPEGPLEGFGPRPRSIIKFSEYVGSFPVKEADSRRRVWIIEEQMRFLKDCPRRRAVTLRFCQQGVKMYEADGETLLMAHALRRIQYTTCRPEDRQFAFVSRNPHRPSNQLFCHLFVGGQPSEARVLNLLLCRSFQLQYLASHPEALDTRGPARVQRKGPGAGGVRREPLDPEEVTQNVNALVSFRRLPGSGEDNASSCQNETPESTKMARSSSSDTPYCSPTLVRKKAIRSKVIRCGAYRYPSTESPLRDEVKPESAGRTGRAPWELSEKPDVLLDAVWFCTGIDKDSSLGLLKEDRMGAFLLRPDPGRSGHFTLYMSTQCGVIPYKIYTNHRAKYCFEHLPQEFPSLAALVEHHAGPDGSLFFQLAHGRVNPCYEAEDPPSSPSAPAESALEERSPSPPVEPGLEERSPSPPAEPTQEERSPSPPAEPGLEERSPSPPAEPGLEERSPSPPAEPGLEERSPSPPAEPGLEERSPSPPAEPGLEERSPRTEEGPQLETATTELTI